MAVITTGQYFGASGITDEKPREYSAVVSVSDTRLLSLNKDVISSFMLFSHFRNSLRLSKINKV
jgi:CRP-like cAMP-binding protein